MNDSILKGKWNEFKGEVQRIWGEITHDDLDRTQGNVKEIGGIFEKKYGSLKDDAKRSFDDLINKYSGRVADKSDTARANVQNALGDDEVSRH